MKRYDEESREVHPHIDSSPENTIGASDPVLDSSEPFTNAGESETNDAEISYAELDDVNEDAASLSDNEGDRPPSPRPALTAIAFWGVILLGGVLRFWGLGDKPLHHDESMHAYYSMQLLYNNIEN